MKGIGLSIQRRGAKGQEEEEEEEAKKRRSEELKEHGTNEE